MQLSFYNWLIVRYKMKSGIWKETSNSNIAYDICHDPSFPRDCANPKSIIAYLESHNARREQIAMAKSALKIYTKKHHSRR